MNMMRKLTKSSSSSPLSLSEEGVELPLPEEPELESELDDESDRAAEGAAEGAAAGAGAE